MRQRRKSWIIIQLADTKRSFTLSCSVLDHAQKSPIVVAPVRIGGSTKLNTIGYQS